MRTMSLVVLVLLLMPVPLRAHEVKHRVDREGPAVVVTLSYVNAGAFSYERAEIFRPGEEVPFQVGQTDARGRVTFLPDTAGVWRLRVFSEDGHGADLSIETDASGVVVDTGAGLADRFPSLMGGLTILLLALAMMSLFSRRGKG